MHTACILLLFLTTWNILSSDKTSHSSDRVAISLAYSIIIECLIILSLPFLAWCFTLPGIIALLFLGVYRVFFGVKDITFGYP
jgi:uncharacterized membrane protein